MKKNQKEDSYSKITKELGPFLNLGLQLAITIVLFCFIGMWIDKHYSTTPIWLIVFSFLGIALGFYNFFRTINKYSNKKK